MVSGLSVKISFPCMSTAGHVTRTYQSAPQDMFHPVCPRTSQHPVERSAKLKMEEQLMLHLLGYEEFYNLSISIILTPKEGTMWGKLWITGEHDDALFILVMLENSKQFICL